MIIDEAPLCIYIVGKKKPSKKFAIMYMTNYILYMFNFQTNISKKLSNQIGTAIEHDLGHLD
jgi:hypothetical protein